MGYSTDFEGALTLSKPLTPKQFGYINQFSSTRRMKRNVDKLMELYNGKGGFPGKTIKKKNTPEEIYGVDGAFFVGEKGIYGENNDSSVIDNNCPPGQKPYSERSRDFKISYKEQRKLIDSGKCQPGLWCQWVVQSNEDDKKGHQLEWDGGEKFNEYIAWLKYLITNFFEPWNVKLNGEIEWFGEENSDRGKIVVTDNVVEVYDGNIVYTKAK